MAKLDPANWKSAKDVYDERAAEATKKRKREEHRQEEHRDGSQQEAAQKDGTSSKRRKKDSATQSEKPVTLEKIADTGEQGIKNQNFAKRMRKRARRTARNEQERQRQQAKMEAALKKQGSTEDTNTQRSESRSEKGGSSQNKRQEPVMNSTSKSSSKAESGHTAPKPQFSPSTTQEQHDTRQKDQDNEHGDWSDEEEEESADEVGEIDRQQDENVDEEEEVGDVESTATSSEGVPEILSPAQDSAASSVSSILPPTSTAAQAQSSKIKTQGSPTRTDTNLQQSTQKSGSAAKITMSESERLAARQRLQEHIESLRSQRKADEKPPRSRAELLEQRKRKEEERKAAKKAQRQKEKDEEAIRQDEEMARRFSPGGSGSLLGSPRSPIVDSGSPNGGGYSYGRIAFEDGTSLDPNTLSDVKERKHKGPQDAATALKAAEAKQARLAALDGTKRAGIAEKDMWLNARKRAHGEKVRDNQSLLKKALKRQEKQKSRSGTEWDNRIEGVRSAQEAKQKKRTENLQKRKDEKFAKKTGAGKKKIKRPGFEGSFRGRTGKAKK